MSDLIRILDPSLPQLLDKAFRVFSSILWLDIFTYLIFSELMLKQDRPYTPVQTIQYLVDKQLCYFKNFHFLDGAGATFKYERNVFDKLLGRV